MSTRNDSNHGFGDEDFGVGIGQAMRDSVGGVQAPEGLAQAAIGRARQIRRRRTATVMGSGLVTAAIVISGGVLWRGSGTALDPLPALPTSTMTSTTTATNEPSAPPTSPTTSPSTSSSSVSSSAGSADARVVSVVPGRLSVGSVPGVGYVVSVSGGYRMVLASGARLELGGAWSAVPYGSAGALVWSSPDLTDFGSLSVVGSGPGGSDPAGRVTTVPVVDHEGRVALWRASGSGGVLEQRSASGAVLASVTTAAGPVGYVVTGQVGAGRVLATRVQGAASGGDGVVSDGVVLTSAQGELRTVPGMVQGLVASESAGLYAGVTRVIDGQIPVRCSQVRRVVDDSVVWSSCEDRVPAAFSPDGRYVALLPAADGLGFGDVTVVDLSSGREVLRVKLATSGVAFESNSSLLMPVAAEKAGASGIVRCTVSGVCERADTAFLSTADGYLVNAQ